MEGGYVVEEGFNGFGHAPVHEPVDRDTSLSDEELGGFGGVQSLADDGIDYDE